MQNQSDNPFLNFLSAKYLAAELFDVSLNESDFVEKAMRIWRSMGNVCLAVHEYEFTVPDSFVVPMPCNTERIEAVTTSNYGSNNSDAYDDDTIFTQIGADVYNYGSYYADALNSSASSFHVRAKQDIHPQGDFVNYELQGTRGSYSLRFNSSAVGSKAFVLYRAIVIGEDSLPFITPKEQEAIAYRVAYEVTQKNAFKGDQLAMNLLGTISQQSDVKMAAAKIPEYVSQNGWDSVLRAMTRHDRKQYGVSFKPVL
jgi:hypothetical protein